MTAPELEGLREILGKLLERGQIYECDAAFASPAFVIKKKLGGYRLLVDMRQMNAAIKDYSWPLPNIGALLDRCNECFSNCLMAIANKSKTVFISSPSLNIHRTPRFQQKIKTEINE
ncbi:hypothetical protein BX661DRAFT_169981 [Kickxella alabastrina]|uniref:uncharacterized protein n=1 Tax=Kickxella alabastrina TaxID=61397 RepID=UPI0022204F93|nr:uncharacterized protein BX661DRAFT_169981 [Kickxella alabastrina]KAI7832170.1 hypothetical protein BX661DRAFT_169981 [Kickxella alabastrina]